MRPSVRRKEEPRAVAGGAAGGPVQSRGVAGAAGKDLESENIRTHLVKPTRTRELKILLGEL